MQTPYTAGWAKIPLDNLLVVNELIGSSSIFSVYCCMFRKLPLNGDNICDIMLNPQYTIRNVNDDYFSLMNKFEKLVKEDKHADS